MRRANWLGRYGFTRLGVQSFGEGYPPLRNWFLAPRCCLGKLRGGCPSLAMCDPSIDTQAWPHSPYAGGQEGNLQGFSQG